MSRTVEHCLVTEPLSDKPGAVQAVTGDLFDLSLASYRQGEVARALPRGLGEEVATVLEGEFDVDAAGEQYRLTPGEGILIPRGEPRRWQCVSASGTLYRAVLRADQEVRS